MTNQETYQLLLLITLTILISYVVSLIVPYLTRIKLPLVSAKTNFEIWMGDFENEALKQKAIKERAIANPFDRSTCGIPTNDELKVLCSAIQEKGYGAHINTGFDLNHLTIHWD